MIGYLLNIVLRDFFLSEMLVHKVQCVEISHAPIEHFIRCSRVEFVQLKQAGKKDSGEEVDWQEQAVQKHPKL